jgi:two-component system sensor histidine kinase ChvG
MRSSLTLRLLLFNVLLVFLPAAGLLYLGTYERELLEAQERAMVQQGRVLAAALAAGPLDPEAARPLLERLNGRVESRIRVVDRDGRIVADSARYGPRSGAGAPAPPPPARASWLYRAGRAAYGIVRGVLPPEAPAVESLETATAEGRLPGREISAALSGRYGRAVRASAGRQRSVTLTSAIPIVRNGEVTGAVVTSQSTHRILQDLYRVRVSIFLVCLASVAVAIGVSLWLSTTIARPLRALARDAAAILDRSGRLKGSLRSSARRDEIGELSRALSQLTKRLEERQTSLEAFAADVSHEFKNPLASIRTAAEMLSETDDPVARRRFPQVIQAEVGRMERLLSGVAEMTRIDSRLEAEPQEPVALPELLARLCDGFRLRAPRLRFELDLPPEAISVRASADRLAQVFENLLDNAASFAPEGSAVRVSLLRESGAAVVRIEDEGPGIPPEHLSRIFDRFFTWRPASAAAAPRHSGLGLSIVKTIVEGYGGSIAAENRSPGAVFTVTLPASRTGIFRVRT